MAGWAQNDKITRRIVFVVKILMMTFEDIRNLVITAVGTLSHVLSFEYLRRSNLVNMVGITRLDCTPSTTKSCIFLMALRYKFLFAKSASKNWFSFSQSPKLAFSTATVLLRTSGDCFKRFTTNLTNLCISCQCQSPTPTDTLSCVFSKIKVISSFSFFHNYNISQGIGGCQCL